MTLPNQLPQQLAGNRSQRARPDFFTASTGRPPNDTHTAWIQGSFTKAWDPKRSHKPCLKLDEAGENDSRLDWQHSTRQHALYHTSLENQFDPRHDGAILFALYIADRIHYIPEGLLFAKRACLASIIGLLVSDDNLPNLLLMQFIEYADQLRCDA